jgi:hypothetical protein
MSMKDLIPVVFAVLTAIFWGTYGPVLHESRAYLKSPFKPYLLIGIAYLIWGIGGGIIGMWYKKDDFSLNSFIGPGGRWGFAAGTLGAWGALTLTLAMFSGGRPYIVMPIVFGGAVTVSALVSVWKESEHTTVNPMLWVGVAGIVICAAIVAYFTPTAPPGSPAKRAAEAQTSAAAHRPPS